MYIYLIIISDKRVHAFEEQWGGVYGRVWREGREEINYNFKNKQINKQKIYNPD